MAMVGLVLAATVGVVGCTSDTDDEYVESPAPTVSATAVPDPGPDIAAAEEKLPIPPDEIAEWASTAVPGPGTDGHVSSFSGWLSDATSAHYVSRFQSLEPGAYQAQIACRGEGTISAYGGELDAEPSPQPTECANATIAFDITTTGVGMELVLDLEGDPSIYAVSVRRIG